MSFEQFLQILKARRIALLAVLFTVVLTALGVSLLLPKQYTAEASIAIDTGKLDPLSVEAEIDLHSPELGAAAIAQLAAAVDSGDIAGALLRL